MGHKGFIAIVVGLLAVIGGVIWVLNAPVKPLTLKEALPITRFNLSNGLTLLVVENPRAETISHMIFIRKGAADDPAGKSGLAHYAEHMMFKGTKTVSGDEYDRRIAALGGEGNAFTTSDYTAYYVNAPASALERVMSLEADRFMNLRFDDLEAKTELSVVQEERKLRIESSPQAILAEQMDAVQFVLHPYRIPTIGFDQDIANLTSNDVRNFIARNYVPDNMVLVVSGAVQPKNVRRLAMRYFGAMKQEKSLKREWATEPPARAARLVTYRDDRVSQRQWVRQYAMPSLGMDADKTTDILALGLATQWLGGGRTGLLYQMLVDEMKVAVNVGAYYNDAQVGPGTLSIYVTPAEGVSLQHISRSVDKALQKILAMTPTDEELARAKTLQRADIVYAQDSLMGIPSYLGLLAMVGKNEQYFYQLPEAINALLAQDMSRVLQSYLKESESVTGYLLPRKTVAQENAP